MHDIRWLRSLCNTNEGPFLRPFAPNAQWNSASVIVVGTNPATPLREKFADFDNYSTALTRYPARFEKIYSSKHTVLKRSGLVTGTFRLSWTHTSLWPSKI